MEYSSKRFFTVATFFIICFCQPAQANNDFFNYSGNGIQNAIQHAIDHHPEVQAKWHSFISASFSEDASRSGFRPRIDLTMGYDGHRQDYGPNRHWDGGYANITLRQMLYDGSFTGAEVARFNNLQLASYFELLESAEKIAYEAFAAYLDILRQREMVDIARKNLNKHHTVFKQVQKSAKAGVARSADLEQINGRMALAHSNLITEMTNLHDYTARYLRIIGALPPENLEPFNFDRSPLPDTIKEALILAYRGSPQYHAAIRRIHASENSVTVERSGYQPRIDFKARYGTQNYDTLGYREGQSEGSVGLEITYNLYNGARNRNSIKRALEDVNTAKEQRDLTCLNIRQALQVSYNNAIKISEQLPILNQHRQASDKVSTAYKKQFDIGQRSLLDVLDIESEYFQASRSWINARYDLDIARAKTLAAMGKLIEELKLMKSDLPTLSDLGEQAIYVDENSACPAYDINASEPMLLDADMDGINDLYDQCPKTPITDVVDVHGCSVLVEKTVTKRIDVQFAHESAVVERQYYPVIQELADFLKRFPNTEVEISGHSSLGGTEKFNDRLSSERAHAIANILGGFFGVAPERIKAAGYGTTRLIVKEKSAEADKINRRIEAKVTASQQVSLKRDEK